MPGLDRRRARFGCERFLHPVAAVLASLQPWNALTEPVIGLAIHVHRALGPGLLESVYAACLAHELRKAGTPFVAQRPLPVQYDGVHLDCGYRLDLVVAGQLIVEVKSVQALAPIHTAQILTYLKLTGCPIGLLINFNVPLLKNGIKRVINPHPREEMPVPDVPKEAQEP
jgi:GxxExxY protein